MNNLLAFPKSSNTLLQDKKNLELEIAALRKYEIELEQEQAERLEVLNAHIDAFIDNRLFIDPSESVPFFKSVANSILNCLKGLAIAFLVWASFVALIGLLSLI